MPKRETAPRGFARSRLDFSVVSLRDEQSRESVDKAFEKRSRNTGEYAYLDTPKWRLRVCACFVCRARVSSRVDSGEKEFKVQKENFERALAGTVCLERGNFSEQGHRCIFTSWFVNASVHVTLFHPRKHQTANPPILHLSVPCFSNILAQENSDTRGKS